MVQAIFDLCHAYSICNTVSKLQSQALLSTVSMHQIIHVGALLGFGTVQEDSDN